MNLPYSTFLPHLILNVERGDDESANELRLLFLEQYHEPSA